jgi:two-component system OmpR family sensor kinase
VSERARPTKTSAARRPWTLRARLVVALLAVAAVGLAAVGGVSLLLLRQSLIDRIDDQLRTSIRPLLRAEQFPGGGRRAGPPGAPGDFRVQFFSPDGVLLDEIGRPTDDRSGPGLGVFDSPAYLTSAGLPFDAPDVTGGSDWRSLAAVRGNGTIVVVSISLGTVDATVSRLLGIEAAVGFGVLLLAGVVSTAVVRVGMRPLSRIEETAEAIAAGDLERRVESTDRHTETGRLGAALNTMLGRITSALRQRQVSEDRLRRFVGDASHELRTPLTSIRGFAELYRSGGATTRKDVDRLMGRIESEAIRMGSLVEDLLLLARLDHERPLDLAEVDLVALASDAVHDAMATSPNHPVKLDAPAEPVRIIADSDRLRQVLANLLANAVRHTPARTPILVRVGWSRASHAPGTPPPAAAGRDLPYGTRVAVLEVDDDGPGVPPDQAARVFDRFYRVDAGRTRDRGGAGLGLAITAALVEAHDGRIELLTRPGMGATFSVLLPVGAG